MRHISFGFTVIGTELGIGMGCNRPQGANGIHLGLGSCISKLGISQSEYTKGKIG